jgi:hypothetical protein
MLLLDVVAVRGVYAWEHLCENFPAKVVLAAIDREVCRGNLNYGVAMRRPFLTSKGRVERDRHAVNVT